MSETIQKARAFVDALLRVSGATATRVCQALDGDARGDAVRTRILDALGDECAPEAIPRWIAVATEEHGDRRAGVTSQKLAPPATEPAEGLASRHAVATAARPRCTPACARARATHALGRRIALGGFVMSIRPSAFQRPQRGAIVVLVALAAACGAQTTTGTGGTSPPSSPPMCGATQCATGQQCCFSTLTCFDPTDATACAVPPPFVPPPGVPPSTPPIRSCAANSHCRADEFCRAQNVRLCAGPGICSPRGEGSPPCGTGPGGPICPVPVCACDGQRYPTVEAASLAGVRVAGSSAVQFGGALSDGGDAPTTCPSATTCPDGQLYCALTGRCYAASCAGCCVAPPAGTAFPCEDNSQCEDHEYCAGTGCGTPGGCTYRMETGTCEGTLEPVCGCDGRSYQNTCSAHMSRARVASMGACPGR
jgi:hypothetical protein